MRPFRDPPPVELGGLDVGLAQASRAASRAIPRGGRLRVALRPGFAPHAAGALGTAGFLAVGVAAVIAHVGGWAPADAFDHAIVGACLLVGGGSLAAMLRAFDREAHRGAASSARVGMRARHVIRALELAGQPAQGRTAHRVFTLRTALVHLDAPDVARWLPVDVRGRAELLLARLLAARDAGWATNQPLRREIAGLLRAAEQHLAEPTPARLDLRILARRVPDAAPDLAPIDDDDDEAPALAEMKHPRWV